MSRPSKPLPSVFSCRCALRAACLGLLLLAAGGWLVAAAPARAEGSVAQLDRDNGLPTAQLGAPLSSFQGLEKTEDLGRFQTYRRPSDKRRYDRYEVSSISYNFFKDRLYSVVLKVEGKGNVRGINKLLERTYGKDHTNDTLPIAKTTLTVEVREWAGSKAYCVMKYGSDDDGGELRLIDRATWDLLEAPRREKLQANKQMLQGNFLNGDLDKKPTPSPAPEQSPAPDQTLKLGQ